MAVFISAYMLYQDRKRTAKIRQLKMELDNELLIEQEGGIQATSNEEIIREQLSRNYAFFGENVTLLYFLKIFTDKEVDG